MGLRGGGYGGSIANSDGDPRRWVASIIAECDGNLLKSAHYLGVHRSRIYQLIESMRLWPLVNEVRRRAARNRRRLREERWIQSKRMQKL